MSDRRRHSNKPRQEEFRVVLRPRTEGHKELIRTIAENIITIVTGPAGCSKSFSSIGLGCEYLLGGKVDKLVITRPAVEASPKGLGFLPGNLNEKMSPYVNPAVQHMIKFLGKNTFLNYRNMGKILIEPLEYMRGMTYDDSYIIAEEMQNASKEQIIMLITRIGENSKCILNGDIFQTDIPNYDSDYITDLGYVMNVLKKAQLQDFGICELHDEDIVRNKIIGPFLRLFR